VSADGLRLSTGHNGGPIRVWDIATGRRLCQLSGHTDQISGVCFSPDGATLASVAQDQSIRTWNLAGAKEERNVGLPAAATAVAYSPDGRLVALYFDDEGYNGVVLLHDATTFKVVRELKGLRGTEALAFSPDGQTLATAGVSQTVRLWQVATGDEVVPAVGHPGPVTTVAVSPDGNLLATCSNFDGAIRLWDTATGREVRRLSGTHTGVDEVTFSPDGRLLASAAWGQPVLLWNMATGAVVHRLVDHSSLGAYLRFAADGKTLATAGQETAVGLWDCGTGKLVRELTAPPTGVASLLSFADGRLLAIERPDPDEDADAVIVLWDLTDHRIVRRFSGHRGLVSGAALSPDGRSVVTRGTDRTVRVWEVATGQERVRYQDPGETSGWTGTQFVAIAPGGRTLVAAATMDPLARRWNLATGRLLSPLAGHRSWVGAVEYSADGRLLVTGSQDTTCLVWDARPGEKPDVPPTAGLPPAELTRLWDELRERDAGRAYRAVWSIAAAGEQAVTFVSNHLRPQPPADARLVGRWIAELDHPNFLVRERATTALMAVADQAEDALRAALERTRSAEVRQRLRRLLAAPAEAEWAPDRLREHRAVEVLELIGTPAARQSLAAVAEGAPGSFLGREAAASGRRLDSLAPRNINLP
jgi:WD40 repeat protein